MPNDKMMMDDSPPDDFFDETSGENDEESETRAWETIAKIAAAQLEKREPEQPQESEAPAESKPKVKILAGKQKE